MERTNINKIGKTSATLAAVFAITYSIFQLLSTFGVIPHPDELFWLFLPSLLLAPSFLIAMISLHYSVDGSKKIFTAIGVAFAMLYSAFVVIVYFTQLAVIIPQLKSKAIDETHALAFTDNSFMVAVDCIGYAFMSASTFAAAFAFRESQKNRWLFLSLLINGLLAPVIVAAFFIPHFLYAGALWIFTFPLAMTLSAKLFSNESPNPQKKANHKPIISPKIVKHALLTWLLFIPIVVINGVVREAVYQPLTGELGAHQISTVTASIAFLTLTYFKMRSALFDVAKSTLLGIGFMWVAITILTEFAIGRFITGASWDKLLHDYNFIEGRIWILLLFTMLVAPLVIKSGISFSRSQVKNQPLSPEKM